MKSKNEITIKKIFNDSIKLYKFKPQKHFFKWKYKRTFLFVPGFHGPLVNTNDDSMNDSELLIMKWLSNNTNLDSHYFNFFSNSTNNNNPQKMRIEDFYNDLINVIQYLEKDYDEIIPISNSIGSVLLLKLKYTHSKKISKSFLCGPVSPGDVKGVYKHRSNNGNFIEQATNFSSLNIAEVINFLNIENDKWMNKNTINKRIFYTFIRGSDEFKNFIDSIDNFYNTNHDMFLNANFYNIDNCGHVIYFGIQKCEKASEVFFENY